ncbi:MAG: hypothetical protein ACRD5L_08940, partial [Bryobacteraceae bacterium]
VMSSPTPPGLPPQFPARPAAQPKSKGPLFWILISLGVLVMVVICAAAVGSYFVYRAAKSAGLDPTLMKNNPGLAVAKLAVAANPDLQTVSEDDGSGAITVRQKSTGDVLTLRFDAEKKTLVATDKDGKEVTFRVSGDKDTGSFEVNTDKGNVKFGASSSNNLPAWVPTYPGSSPQGTFSSQTPEGDQSTYSFKTKDGTEKVLDFYGKELANAGLQQTTRAAGAAYGGMLTAEDSAKGRTVMITVSNANEESNVGVTVVEKKQP